MDQISQDKKSRRRRLGPETQASDTTIISKRYSLAIKSLRIALPLAALGLMVIVLTWQPEDKPIDFPQNMAEIEQKPEPEIEQNELINPDFASNTKNGAPYRIKADRAVQKIKQPDLIYLENLIATLETASGPLHLRAEDGTYHQKTKLMTMAENVVIRKPDIGTFYLRTLKADLELGNASSPHPVRGESRDGTLQGMGLKIRQNGEKIIVQGPAKLVLNNGSKAWN